ncbi:hypothetical protein GGI42DRAFT_329344 [Trichoderma sp. SZMC 28013]
MLGGKPISRSMMSICSVCIFLAFCSPTSSSIMSLLVASGVPSIPQMSGIGSRLFFLLILTMRLCRSLSSSSSERKG